MIANAPVFDGDQWAAQGGLIGLIVGVVLIAGIGVLFVVIKANARQQANSHQFSEKLVENFSKERKEVDIENRNERVENSKRTTDAISGLTTALSDLSVSIASSKKGTE